MSQLPPTGLPSSQATAAQTLAAAIGQALAQSLPGPLASALANAQQAAQQRGAPVANAQQQARQRSARLPSPGSPGGANAQGIGNAIGQVQKAFNAASVVIDAFTGGVRAAQGILFDLVGKADPAAIRTFEDSLSLLQAKLGKGLIPVVDLLSRKLQEWTHRLDSDTTDKQLRQGRAISIRADAEALERAARKRLGQDMGPAPEAAQQTAWDFAFHLLSPGYNRKTGEADPFTAAPGADRRASELDKLIDQNRELANAIDRLRKGPNAEAQQVFDRFIDQLRRDPLERDLPDVHAREFGSFADWQRATQQMAADMSGNDPKTQLAREQAMNAARQTDLLKEIKDNTADLGRLRPAFTY